MLFQILLSQPGCDNTPNTVYDGMPLSKSCSGHGQCEGLMCRSVYAYIHARVPHFKCCAIAFPVRQGWTIKLIERSRMNIIVVNTLNPVHVSTMSWCAGAALNCRIRWLRTHRQETHQDARGMEKCAIDTAPATRTSKDSEFIAVRTATVQSLDKLACVIPDTWMVTVACAACCCLFQLNPWTLCLRLSSSMVFHSSASVN
jgi:hypothetical protein